MSDIQHLWQEFETGLITLEMETAFKVSAAEGDNLFDAVFMSDANGLPCIPGESIAGVLRHALAGSSDPEEDPTCRQVFGYQEGDKGAASRIRISFAHVHNAKDRPVAFWGEPTDDLLAFLQSGVGRDHVRIGKHGAVDGRGKFDELIVPAGARFTFELSVSHASPKSFNDLLAILCQPNLRLGGGSRHGLGRFRVIRAKTARFNLSEPKSLQQLSNLPVAISEAVSSPVLRAMDQLPKANLGEGWVQGSLTLTPIGTWAIGGGAPTGHTPPELRDDKSWDRLPLTEPRIQWTNNQATITSADKTPFLVPGSSVKGALRHRVAFHARRREGRWLDPELPTTWSDDTTKAETELFGEVRNDEQGLPGRVYISDTYLNYPVSYQTLQHVSLDRFTQAAMDHLLYDEVVLGECQLQLDFAIQVGKSGEVSDTARQALHDALIDLSEGRLAIGVGRGHGRFRGKLKWFGGKSLQRSAQCQN